MLSVFILPIFIFAYLPLLDISYKWNDTMYVTFCVWLLSCSMSSKLLYMYQYLVPFLLTVIYFWVCGVLRRHRGLTKTPGSYGAHGLLSSCGGQGLLSGCGGQGLLSGCGGQLLSSCGGQGLLSGCGGQGLLSGCGGQGLLSSCGGQGLLSGCGGQLLPGCGGQLLSGCGAQASHLGGFCCCGT